MSLSVDLYVSADSWLHRLDPRVKLWAAAAGTILAFLLPDPAVLLVLLGGMIGLLRAGRVPMERLRWVLRGLLPLTMLILLIQPWFLVAGRELLALGPLRLTEGGLAAALSFALRANLLALLALMPLLTTPHDDLVRGLVQMGLPYTWGLTVTLGLRYIPIAAGLFLTIRQAQEARGLDLTRGGLLRRARLYVPILTALVIASVRLSDQLAMAMVVRGLGAGPRTERRTFTLSGADWAAALVMAGLLIGAGAWRVAGG